MVERHNNTFSGWDYAIFALLLCISAGIGIWHALRGGRQKTTKEYLLADRGMGAIPVGMSVVATFMSAIAVLGTPAEIYNFGTMFWWFGLAYAICCLLVAFLYMPVFYKLQITSVFEVGFNFQTDSLDNMILTLIKAILKQKEKLILKRSR